VRQKEGFRETFEIPGNVKPPLQIYSKTNFELQIDIDMTSPQQGCAARTTRERVAQNFRTSFAFECELRAENVVCLVAKQLTFVLARASGDPFAQIRLIKIPPVCADSKPKSLSGSQKKERAAQNGRLGHKVAKQRKRQIGRMGATQKNEKETLKLGESLLAVKGRQPALWFSRNMTHITVFN